MVFDRRRPWRSCYVTVNPASGEGGRTILLGGCCPGPLVEVMSHQQGERHTKGSHIRVLLPWQPAHKHIAQLSTTQCNTVIVFPNSNMRAQLFDTKVYTALQHVLGLLAYELASEHLLWTHDLAGWLVSPQRPACYQSNCGCP